MLYAEANLGGILAETVSHVSSRHDTSKRLPKDISRDMSSECQTLHRNPEAIEAEAVKHGGDRKSEKSKSPRDDSDLPLGAKEVSKITHP